MIRRVLMLAMLLMLLTGLPARAQEISASVTAAVSGTVTVGDPVPMRLEVIHPAGTAAILPAIEGLWGDFEIRNLSAPETTEEAGGLRTRLTFDAVLFAPGQFNTPPLPVTVSDRTGVTLQAVAAPVPVTVESVLGEADTEPHDIKPQAALRGGWFSPQLVGGVLGLLVAALGIWLLRWWLRRGGMLGRTALQRALDELDAIAAAGYPAQNKYKELYLAVSHTVRRHAEREFGVDLHERTTNELRALLRGLPLPPELARRLLTLFAESDLVKFAQVTPTPESASALIVEARAVSQGLSAAHAAAESNRPAQVPAPVAPR